MQVHPRRAIIALLAMSLRSRLHHAARTLALASLFAACQATHRQPGVSISSEPPGATVVLDGVDTGFVTPCDIAISREKHEIKIELEGYETAVRHLEGATRRDIIYYDEANAGMKTWRFPLWLNYEDGIFPWKRELSYSPARIFVRLRLATED
jgi:hypothetical protein